MCDSRYCISNTMCDARCYSKAFMLEFIHLYRSLESLWKVKSPSYSDRDLKAEGYQKLVDHMKKVDPEADKEFVARKINTMRSVYRKELHKVMKSKEAGEKLYTPKLWYYKHLNFLYSQDQEGEDPSPASTEAADREYYDYLQNRSNPQASQSQNPRPQVRDIE